MAVITTHFEPVYRSAHFHLSPFGHSCDSGHLLFWEYYTVAVVYLPCLAVWGKAVCGTLKSLSVALFLLCRDASKVFYCLIMKRDVCSHSRVPSAQPWNVVCTFARPPFNKHTVGPPLLSVVPLGLTGKASVESSTLCLS